MQSELITGDTIQAKTMIRFSVSALIVIAMGLPPISAQSAGSDSHGASLPTQRIPSCQSFPGGTSGEMATVSSFEPESAYVDLPIEQLRKMVRFLNPTTRQETPLAGDSGTAASLSETEFILSRTGATIIELLRRTPNLIANEQVRLVGQNNYSGHLNVSGLTVNRPTKWNNTSEYEYRILRKRNSVGGNELVEVRTDVRGKPIDNSSENPNRPE